MARLNQPANFTHAPSAVDRTSSVIDTEPFMPSPALRPLSIEASLRSCGNDDIPLSPQSKGSTGSPFSPADCRTLKRILCDTSNSSPTTSGPFEPKEQSPSHATSSTSPLDGCVEKATQLQAVGEEDTDAGYEDENDSVELSESVEEFTTMNTWKPLEGSVSLSASKSRRRLQDSVPFHDEKNRLRYTSRHSLVAKKSEIVRYSDHHSQVDPIQVNTTEDSSNLLDTQASSVSRMNLGRSKPARQFDPNDTKFLDCMNHRSTEKVPENACVTTWHAKGAIESGVLGPGLGAQHNKVRSAEHSDMDEFSAGEEGTASEEPEPQCRKSSQRVALTFKAQTLDNSLAVTSYNGDLLVPNTPTAVAQTPDENHTHPTTKQTALETPFAGTLSYFKQYNGTENSPSKRRRNTVLPHETAEVANVAADSENKAALFEQHCLHPVAPDVGLAKRLPRTSAKVDLEGMISTEAGNETDRPAGLENNVQGSRQITTSMEAMPEGAACTSKAVIESEVDDSQKQLILYPQHPAFVNVIGMIPATMFWVTAAPIVKFTNIAFDLLIDKLRETYL